MTSNARDIVRSVLPQRMADEIWSGQYDKVLPITFNTFELSAVLPAVFYMFRFGQRRGRGQFLKTFAPDVDSARDRRRQTTVERVSTILAASDNLEGFDSSVEQAILGDFLLGFNFENIRHDLGRDKQLQRVAPTHYMASWIDLPETSAHLRFVPEMIVSILANQDGQYVEQTPPKKRTWFPVVNDQNNNLLQRVFSTGINRSQTPGNKANLSGDKFDEGCLDVGLDQLVIIRLAQLLGRAPDKTRGKEGARISNQHPIAEKAARNFSDDLRRFVRSYASEIPRYSFVNILESGIAVGMTSILSSVIQIVIQWAETGIVDVSQQQHRPIGLFVDCSHGVDRRLQDLSEQSFDDFMRRVERIPLMLMILRILDYVARNNRRIKSTGFSDGPFATQWINTLGSVLHSKHHESAHIHRQIDDYCEMLAVELNADYPEAATTLRNDRREVNPIRRLAISLMPLMGTKVRRNFVYMVDSTLNVDRPNGLAHKRRTARRSDNSRSGRRQRDVRSLVFADSVLDYLVHLNFLRSGNKCGIKVLSLNDLIHAIRVRYGFYVDTAPPGMTISNEFLRRNRMILERRLRDLGLLVGVNDAEAMKRLCPRFEPQMGA